MAARTPVLLFSLLALLIWVHHYSAISSEDVDFDDELSILREDDVVADSFVKGSESLDPGHLREDGEDDDSDDFENYDDFGGADAEDHEMPKVDDKDVFVLKERNFTTIIENNRFVMVEFYAPWCGHCQSLAPDYAAAATELKDDDVVLAKVDATEENELAQEYDVQGFPTILFFVDGAHKPFSGQRNKDAIVTWIRKKIGPGLYNITTVEDAEQILNSENKVVLGFLNSLVGLESNELAAASRQEDDVNFYQTVNADVAKVFHIDPTATRPALVLLKKEAEKLNHFDGNFSKSGIAEFVYMNKLPLVITFTRESSSYIFESAIKKQLLLFATSKDSRRLLPSFQDAAKFFKGKLIFVYVEIDNEEVGKPVSNFFGITGDSPTVLGYTGNDDGKKFLLDGALSVDKIKSFGEDFLEEKLKPFLKSDPIPENNDGDVKIVVGNSLDEIVLDESKDVLLEIYAPWCGHCQSLEPTYNKLATHLRGIESLVIAKMDGTTNEHPRAKSDGFPTILFFPAGNKSFDPITVDVDRTVVELYKFLKKNAAIPFKLRKPTPKPDTDEVSGKMKDEL